jgi:hypothetical protein
VRLLTWGRLLLVAFGSVVVLAGVVGWALETEYGGSGPESFIEIDGYTVRIYEFDEQGPLDSEGHVVWVLVFEGSQAEADEFTETDAEDRHYLVPALIIAVGAIIVIAARSTQTTTH